MKLQTAADLVEYGRDLARTLVPPAVVELIGDVGAGKTTLAQGIAQGLGITEPVTSPSFTISKQYQFAKSHVSEPETSDKTTCTLVHYDFYRLPDPGIMAEDLQENIHDKNTITIIEWADTVKDLLPENRRTIRLTINDDGSRSVTENSTENPESRKGTK